MLQQPSPHPVATSSSSSSRPTAETATTRVRWVLTNPQGVRSGLIIKPQGCVEFNNNTMAAFGLLAPKRGAAGPRKNTQKGCVGFRLHHGCVWLWTTPRRVRFGFGTAEMGRLVFTGTKRVRWFGVKTLRVRGGLTETATRGVGLGGLTPMRAYGWVRFESNSHPKRVRVVVSAARCGSNIVEPEIRTIVAPMAERTMEELLRAPTEGYGEAIVLPEINADHFEIKTNLLQLVQANPFYGRESENPHAHINSFKRITSTLRFRNVPNDVIKLMMFPYSLEGAAKTWYEKEPPNSILTWEDLVTKFVNQFFPPSKTTHLKNEISRFTQKFEETFSEAWERFKELLRACPHHGFTELTQVDTFYNGLNENEQDSLNAAAGGNLLSKTTREALNIIENKSKVRYSRNRSNASRMNATSSKTDERIDKLADQLSTLVEIVSKKVVTPAPVKAVEESCVTCGGAHSWYNCPATDNNQAS
ncbi:reverse transcriptase domain-containing protein [Tanacetum coccineum]